MASVVVNTDTSEVLTVTVYMEDGREVSFTLEDPQDRVGQSRGTGVWALVQDDIVIVQ